MRLALALIVALCIHAAAVRADTPAKLDQLQTSWIKVCEHGHLPGSGPICIDNVNQAIASMRVTFREVDLHDGLWQLSAFVINACSDLLDDLGPENARTSLALAECVKHRYNRMIDYKGGVLEYLLWFESLGRDLEV